MKKNARVFMTQWSVSVTDKNDTTLLIGTSLSNKMNNKKDNEITLKLKQTVALAVDGLRAENCSVELVWYTQIA